MASASNICTDLNIAKEILLSSMDIPDHAWEPMTSRVVDMVTKRRNGSVLIGGAYFGDHALIAALSLKDKDPENIVVCVEPNSEQRQLLTEDAHNNNLSKFIRIADAVLWDVQGHLFRLDDSDSHAAVQESVSSGI